MIVMIVMIGGVIVGSRPSLRAFVLRVAAVLGLVPVASGTGTQCSGYVYRRGSAGLLLGLLLGHGDLLGVAVVPPFGGWWLHAVVGPMQVRDDFLGTSVGVVQVFGDVFDIYTVLIKVRGDLIGVLRAFTIPPLSL